ncbi:hypothetical protein Pcinc_029351 [Petrolisthes cinctipes]|uniref:Uncharacterized protein n=1 Tax=Petrolisthes cinctipes TaxID=88211 RepID=A0AAE1F111_PETCI|nr:hypothetical protein Pcinc_029351 [Petrolisthes cinctipes]
MKGHVEGRRADCGRRTSALAAHNTLRPPTTPTPAECDRNDDLMALRSYEVRVNQLTTPTLPLPILRSRLDHTPTPTRLLTPTH